MDTHTLEPLMREHPFLRDLSDEHVRVLVGCAKNLHFPAGEFLFREGGPARSIYLIRVGKVALEVAAPGKGGIRVETLRAGDVLGWSWMFAPFRWQTDAVSVDPVVALVLDGECLRKKMEADSALGYALTKAMLAQIYQRLERVRMQRMDVYRSEG